MREIYSDDFRIGDYVLRIKESHLGMGIGDIDIIEGRTINGLTLRNYKDAKGEGTHAPYNFVVVQMSFNFNKGE